MILNRDVTTAAFTLAGITGYDTGSYLASFWRRSATTTSFSDVERRASLPPGCSSAVASPSSLAFPTAADGGLDGRRRLRAAEKSIQ